MVAAGRDDNTVYLDESGTTGNNFFDRETPHFVTAALIVSAAAVDAVERQLDALRTANRVQSRGELKYNRLRRSNTGLGLIRDVGRVLSQHGATINYTVIEKSFNVCAIAVETYIDPTTNPEAPPENDAVLRTEFANILHESIGEATLQEFMVATSGNDLPALRRIGERIAGQLAFHFADPVVSLARLIRLGSANPFCFGERPKGDVPAFLERPTPLTHGFLPSLIHLNRCLEERGLHAALVADHDLQFGPLLDWIFVAPTPEGLGPSSFAEFTASVALPQLTGYSRQDSANCLGVQLADLAAGIAREVLTTRVGGALVSSALHEAWQPFSVCKSRSSHHFWMASSRLRTHDFLGSH